MFQYSTLIHLAQRRYVPDVILRFVNRAFIFTIAALVVLAAKFDHIHSHLSAIPTAQLWRWGYSFFAQDLAVLILVRLLLDHWVSRLPTQPRWLPIPLRFAITGLAGAILLYNIALSLVAINFYIVTGSEIHWRNIDVAADASSWGLILSGTVSFVILICLSLLFGWLLQTPCYGLFGYAADIVNWPFAWVWRKFRSIVLSRTRYAQIPQADLEDVEKSFSDESSSDGSESHRSLRSFENSASASPSLPFRLMQRLLQSFGVNIQASKLKSILNRLTYLVVGIALLIMVCMTIARPDEGSLTFLSWTTVILPFIDFSSFTSCLDKIQPYYNVGIQRNWDDQSALTDPIPFSWLPKNDSLEGFSDWYTGKDHYSAAADPLKISNLEEPLLAPLKEKLQNVSIRHVMLVLLESTRNDIFPIKKGGLIWDRLQQSWPDHKLPLDAQVRLANLTPTANYLTGDYNDGFHHDNSSMKKRGGLHFTNAHTAGTFTLKSMVGTLCGIGPLLTDFNQDWENHIYQPCLPHIFEAMNQLDLSNENASDPYAASKWQSYFYQTATLQYDKFDKLMSSIGFPDNNTIDKDYLRSDKAKHGPVTLKDVNYFGFEEDPLEDYIRDAFVSAKENDERVFLTHITSTSHHAFKMPERETYIPMANGLEDLSHYVNAEGYVDKWLRKILNVLDEQKVANDTLVIFVGDHGLSMPENDITSAYYNPSIGVDHVPLVLSHPQLPAFDVNEAVHSSQILPTILDILLETGSVNSASHKALADLVANYEGQSLIRPLQMLNQTSNQPNWQFTVVNPGRAELTVRDPRHPDRHLVVPIIDNVEWRFSNIISDPREQDSIQGFDFASFLRRVEKKYDADVTKWIEEAAFASRWWVEENHKRWRFGLYAEYS